MDPAASEPVTPRTLGEFRIEAILGEGGSGIVYDATWGPRRVALKVLHPSLADTERVRAQFLAEAQRLQQITHSSVVKVLNVGELPDKRPFLAMERLEGETLAAVLGRGPLPVVQALELFAELCSAVSALHQQGLIHRDLKPENVFIVAGKHAVLLDFGIAKDLAQPSSTTTMEGGVRGTPAYMAPERFFGQPAAVATDLYELAVTLYAMLAGRLPWDDLADPEARLSPRPLVDLVAVPAELDVEIRRALSTRAQNRPPDALALLEAIRTAAGSAGPAASETARMRPQSQLPASVTASDASRRPPTAAEQAPTVTAAKKPWFAERQATTDRGKTPLAWAPTAQAEAAAPAPRAKKWPLIVAGLGAIGLAGGLVAWRLAGGDDNPPAPAAALTPAPSPVPAASIDPWDKGPPREAPASAIKISGPEVALATARAEAQKAILHLPADTSMVIGALLGPLRRDDRFASIIDKAGDIPQMKLALGGLPTCVRSLLSGAEWFVFGSVGFNANEQGTLIVRGRWTREDVEACFATQSEEREMPDGSTMLQLPEVGWLDFLDDHTVYVSVRQDLAAAQVHANVKRGTGLTPNTRALLAKLPEDRVLTFAVDGSGGVTWPGDPLPKSSDASAWLRPTEDGVTFGVTMDTKTEATAKKLEQQLRTETGAVLADANQTVASVQIERDQTRVRIAGSLSSLMLGMVTAAIPTSLAN